LECDGEFALIDGGNVGDSDLVVSYLEQAGVEELKAVICSHAHEDHVGGLPGVLAVYPTAAVYAPTRTYSSDCFDDFVYYTDQQGLNIIVPQVGDTLTVGQAQLEFLGPVESYPETNNTSLVLMARYATNRFLFTGDMETSAEVDLLESGADLKADVLKVGHHGSDSSTSYRFLYEVAPEHAVISVGTDNQYDHPSEQILSRLQDADAVIYRTDRLGTVIAHSDGQEITVTWEDSASPQLPADRDTVYIGNKKSKILHTEGCSSLPSESNRVLFDDLQAALDAGYHPCTRCME
jgi:competence protein ComEC